MVKESPHLEFNRDNYLSFSKVVIKKAAKRCFIAEFSFMFNPMIKPVIDTTVKGKSSTDVLLRVESFLEISLKDCEFEIIEANKLRKVPQS